MFWKVYNENVRLSSRKCKTEHCAKKKIAQVKEKRKKARDWACWGDSPKKKLDKKLIILQSKINILESTIVAYKFTTVCRL